MRGRQRVLRFREVLWGDPPPRGGGNFRRSGSFAAAERQVGVKAQIIGHDVVEHGAEFRIIEINPVSLPVFAFVRERFGAETDLGFVFVSEPHGLEPEFDAGDDPEHVALGINPVHAAGLDDPGDRAV